MKKMMIFVIAITLSGAAFAGDFENLRTQLNLTALDAQTINSADIIIPIGIQGDITETVNSAKPKYFFQTDDNGNFVCADKSGIRGYNKITVDEFLTNPKKGECTSLINTDLSGANLINAELNGANLINADLSVAFLYKANLSGVILIKADLDNANLNKTYMVGADLSGAYLIGTHFIGANLNKANFSKAHLSGDALPSATHLTGVNRRSRANLSEANLSEANFSEAYLDAAFLIRADLRGTDMRNTQLRGADLREADLRGTNMSGAYMNGAKLINAKYNDKTNLPFDDAEAKKRGMIKV